MVEWTGVGSSPRSARGLRDPAQPFPAVYTIDASMNFQEALKTLTNETGWTGSGITLCPSMSTFEQLPEASIYSLNTFRGLADGNYSRPFFKKMTSPALRVMLVDGYSGGWTTFSWGGMWVWGTATAMDHAADSRHNSYTGCNAAFYDGHVGFESRKSHVSWTRPDAACLLNTMP